MSRTWQVLSLTISSSPIRVQSARRIQVLRERTQKKSGKEVWLVWPRRPEPDGRRQAPKVPHLIPYYNSGPLFRVSPVAFRAPRRVHLPLWRSERSRAPIGRCDFSAQEYAFGCVNRLALCYGLSRAVRKKRRRVDLAEMPGVSRLGIAKEKRRVSPWSPNFGTVLRVFFCVVVGHKPDCSRADQYQPPPLHEGERELTETNVPIQRLQMRVAARLIDFGRSGP